MRWFYAAALLHAVVFVQAQEDSRPIEGIRNNDSSTHALIGGVIVRSEGDLQANIILRKGRIDSVGERVTAPEGARIWDLKGKRIYPGFIEPWLEKSHENDSDGAHWNKKVRPERKMALAKPMKEENLKILRGMGFCVAHLVPKEGIFRGRSAVLLLRDGRQGQQLLDPSTGQILDFDHGGGGYPSSLMGAIALVRQTYSDAKWFQSAHAAHLKEPSLVPRPADNRALAGLGLRDRTFWVARDELDYGRIRSIRDEFKLSVIVRGNGYEYRRINALKRLGCPLIIPMNFPKTPVIDDPAEGLDYSLAELQHWEFAPSNPAFLAKNGVEFSVTSHAMNDASEKFWKSVRVAVKRGLAPRVALAAMTSFPAKLLGIENRCGDLMPGKIANLVVAEGDLFLDEEAKIHTTWVDGLPYFTEEAEKADASGKWEVSWFGLEEPMIWEIQKGKEMKVKVQGGETFRARWKLGRLLLFPPSKLVGGEKGYSRFSASFNAKEKILSGVAVTDGGKTFWWSGRKIEDLDEKNVGKKDKDKENAIPPLEFSTYPAGAYGLNEAPRSWSRLLVRGATIWTSGEAGVIKKGDLLIENGKVVSVGPRIEPTARTKVIDSNGRHVTPGLIDCHSHSAISRGVNEGTHAVTVEVRIADSLDPTDISLYRQLAGGLTTANLLHGSANPMGGQNQVIKLRWGSGADGLRFKGAKPGVKFALGENVKQSNWGDDKTTRYPQTRMGVEQIMKDAFIAAAEYRKERQNAEREGRPHRQNFRLDAILEILDGKRIVHIHSYRQDEILMFVRLAQQFGFSVGTFQHVLEGYKVADAIAEIGAGGSTFSDWWAYKFEVYDAIPHNGALLHEAGVVTSFNSDNSELACRMNVEAAKAVKYGGVSEEEALKFVTINPAKQLRIDDRVGSIEPGKDADFVIWSGHPLSTYSRAEQTWIEGKLYFNLDSDKKLRKQAHEERSRLVDRAIMKKIKDPDPAAEEDKKEKEKVNLLSKRPWWVPVSPMRCTTITRGLYHDGQSLHTCTVNGCCENK